jgi:four helix bundle protein
MTSDELKKRIKQFVLRVIRLVTKVPTGRVGDVIARQVLRSATSVGANYREALRASSKRHFISFVEIASREADETLYWLELLVESGMIKPALLTGLMKECNELVAILTATGRSAKRRA